jgi:Domain of Unknown Function (DUF928)
MIAHIRWLLHNFFRAKILTSCILILTLGFSNTALAGYKAPRSQKPPSGYTDSSGVRGACQDISPRELTILAPINHVGQTTSIRPTFAWFVFDKQPLPIEFSLYEFDEGSKPKLLHKSKLQSYPGVMKFTLSSKVSPLKVGKTYLWQLQAVCNSNHPSRDPVARAEIQVVRMPLTLLTALSRTSDRYLKANLYAEAGIWYDALQEVLPSTSKGQLGTMVVSLLEDLAKLEQPKQSRYLNIIAMNN